jgi:hypothetical protein
MEREDAATVAELQLISIEKKPTFTRCRAIHNIDERLTSVYFTGLNYSVLRSFFN